MKVTDKINRKMDTVQGTIKISKQFSERKFPPFTAKLQGNNVSNLRTEHSWAL
jgi:hypothetical protein